MGLVAKGSYMFTPSHASAALRRAAFLAATATTAWVGASNAQAIDPNLPTVPLNDTDCNFEVIPLQTTVPPCSVDGTRTVVYN